MAANVPNNLESDDPLRWGFSRLVDSYTEYHGDAAEAGHRSLQSFADDMPGEAAVRPEQAAWTGCNDPWGQSSPVPGVTRGALADARSSGGGQQHAPEETPGPVPASFALASSDAAPPQTPAGCPGADGQIATASTEVGEAGDYAAWAKYYRECAVFFEQAELQKDGTAKEEGRAAPKSSKPKKKASKPPPAMPGPSAQPVAEPAVPMPSADFGITAVRPSLAAVASPCVPAGHVNTPAMRGPGQPIGVPASAHEAAHYWPPHHTPTAEPWIGHPGLGQHYLLPGGQMNPAEIASIGHASGYAPERGNAHLPPCAAHPGTTGFERFMPGSQNLGAAGLPRAPVGPGHPGGGPCGANLPPLSALAGMPRATGGGDEEALQNLLMSWYFSGYYTGLYAGRQGI